MTRGSAGGPDVKRASAPTARATAFAPATVGNVICGFDVLGLALERPGDRVSAVPRGERGVGIRDVRGDDGRIPRDASRNSAGVAAADLLERAGSAEGIDLVVEKGLPLSGGMGGSAASAVAAVVAVDAFLQLGCGERELLHSALKGEEAVSGSAHADNVAPCLLGGIVLVRTRTGEGARRPVVSLPVPEGMSVALLHPPVEVRTSDARAVLPGTVPLGDAVAQWGDTAALAAGLFREDWELIADALVDRVAEPARSGGIPAFAELRHTALDAGALGFGISGAGPSVVAICRSPIDARDVGERMKQTYLEETGAEADLFVSAVGRTGARVVEEGEE